MKQPQEQNKSEFELNRVIERDIAERMVQDRDHRLADAADPANVRAIYRMYGDGWKTSPREFKEDLVAETTQRIRELAENPGTLELLAWLELAYLVEVLQRRRHLEDIHEQEEDGHERS
jgi:hypothetical protein